MWGVGGGWSVEKREKTKYMREKVGPEKNYRTMGKAHQKAQTPPPPQKAFARSFKNPQKTNWRAKKKKKKKRIETLQLNHKRVALCMRRLTPYTDEGTFAYKKKNASMGGMPFGPPAVFCIVFYVV